MYSITQLGNRYAVCKDKIYLDTQWQKGKSYDYCMEEIAKGRANGYGIITGEVEGLGLVAIDFDGESSTAVAEAIGLWLNDNDTTQWTSGKKGHHQRLYKIPQPHLPFWSDITKHDLKQVGKAKAIGDEHLEIRYNNHASVLPESVHPETGYYKWINGSEARELSFAESYDLLNQCTIFHSEVTADDELNLIHEALTYISPDDYHTWVMVGASLYRHGIDITVWEAWSQQSPKYKPQEINTKWQSFSKITNINLGTLIHYAKVNGFDQSQWMRQNLKKQRKALNNTLNNSNPDTAENNVISLTQQLVDKLSSPDIAPDQRDLQIAVFCHQHKVSSNTICRAIESRQRQTDTELDLEQLSKTFNDLSAVPQQKLDLAYLLGDYPATVIEQIASVVPTNPDALLTIMLPVIASVIGTRSNIVVNHHIGYYVPFILRTMIVAPSGKKKSPTARLAIDCLHKKNYQLYQRYLSDYEYYQEQLEEKGNKPQEPKQSYVLLQDATIDGMITAHAENPNGFLVYCDEVYGYFNRMNKFTKGGDDVQRDLELYEGKPLIKTRKSKESNVYLPRTAISITGTIQEVALQQILGNKQDLTGISARWLMWCGNMPNGYLQDRTAVDDSFAEMMKYITDSLWYMDLTDLTISDEAYRLLQQWQRTVIDAIPNCNSLQSETKHSKIESDCVKIAGVLHYFYKILHDIEGTEITANIMERAIIIANYYLNHYSYLVEKANGTLLSARLLKVLDIVQRRVIVTANDVFKSSRQFKTDGMTTADVAQLLLQLVALGKAERIATNKGVKVKYVGEKK
ncbi:DUF3987 domain-containing protein [Geminocystis sp. NIES-3709]|uniref:DUF3987 domain-containing protein n=1 Tax=Geminocystis sp. NIES-3709 TaxID=1617448 RepID=UPI0005FC5045|nr:DUF3987 domain-containing protein [Geminocystis sp. NIES-3709]BAQ67103.1 hypothetical protein GM3709_3868 [Geminocystis sp. NIES-3709]